MNEYKRKRWLLEEEKMFYLVIIMYLSILFMVIWNINMVKDHTDNGKKPSTVISDGEAETIYI